MAEREKLIERVQKLLALGSGGTQFEAEVAMNKAQELMVLHNISFKDVEEFVPEDRCDWTTERVWSGRGRSWEMPYVIDICQKFFFVKTIYVGSHMYAEHLGNQATHIDFFGDRENVQIAKLVFQYLCKTFRDLWTKERMKHGWNHSKSRAFYVGLGAGLKDKLKEQRGETLRFLDGQVAPTNTSDTALIRLEKSQSKLEKVFREHHQNLGTLEPAAPVYGVKQFNLGKKMGKNIDIKIEVPAGNIAGTKGIEDA